MKPSPKYIPAEWENDLVDSLLHIEMHASCILELTAHLVQTFGVTSLATLTRSNTEMMTRGSR
jgi:hypothetical protein